MKSTTHRARADHQEQISSPESDRTSRKMALRAGKKGGSDSDDWDSEEEYVNDLTEEERRYGKNRPMGVSNLSMDSLR